MKKTLCMLVAVLMILGLTACGGGEHQASSTEEGFSPALDPSTE